MFSLKIVGIVALATLVSRWIWLRLRQSSASSPPPGIPILTGTKNTDYKALIEGQYVKVAKNTGIRRIFDANV